MTIVLIHCGATEWQAQGRLLGRVELPLSDDAESLSATWVERLHPLNLTRIWHSPDDLARATAKRLGKALAIGTRVSPELAEVDVGLWAGLTLEQLESRYESTIHELHESPLNVAPPEGELFSTAAERIERFIVKQLRKGGDGGVGLVLRPLMFALARCMLERREMSELLQLASEFSEPVVIENAALP